MRPSPPLEPIGVGIIGGGFMASVHARAARTAGARLVGITSSSPESSRRAADSLGFERAYMSVHDLLANPAIKVIHVTTPNTLHAEQALAATAAGKHVVCEKPIATTVDDARRLIDSAEAVGVVGTVPFVYRFHPLVREIRGRLCQGARIFTITGAYLQDWLLNEWVDNWRVRQQLGGQSRAFSDIGSHLLDLVEFVSQQRLTTVAAATETFFKQRGTTPVDTEDAVVLSGRLTGGALMSATISQVAPGRKNGLKLEISTATETLAFDQEQPETMWVGRREQSMLLPRDPAQNCGAAARLSVVPAGHPQGYVDAFAAFVADTYAAIQGAVPDGLPTLRDGYRSAQITAAVMNAAETGQWTDVPTDHDEVVSA